MPIWSNDLQWGCQNYLKRKGQDVHMQKNETRSIPYTTDKNWKWIKELNAKPRTIKLPEENVEAKLHYFGLGNEFLDKMPKP